MMNKTKNKTEAAKFAKQKICATDEHFGHNCYTLYLFLYNLLTHCVLWPFKMSQQYNNTKFHNSTL